MPSNKDRYSSFLARSGEAAVRAFGGDKAYHVVLPDYKGVAGGLFPHQVDACGVHKRASEFFPIVTLAGQHWRAVEV